MDGTAVTLTAKEFDLLAVMAEEPGVVFSRERLLERVWGFAEYVDARGVDVHIRHVREKLGDDAVLARRGRQRDFHLFGQLPERLDAAAAGYLEDIRAAATRMGLLIDDLLAFTKAFDDGRAFPVLRADANLRRLELTP